MTTDKVFDTYLVMQFQAGDKRALGLLVKRHHTRFCNHAFWYTRDMDSSKDVAQESWGVIIKKLYTLRDPHRFLSWAIKIVTRKALDNLKKQKNVREQLKNNELDHGHDVSDNRTSGLVELRVAIKELPENQQLVLQLFYTQDHSLKEIADILNISIGTVKSRLYYAREKLKTILKHKS